MFILKCEDSHWFDVIYVEGQTIEDAYDALKEKTGENDPVISQAWRCEPVTVKVRFTIDVE